VVLTITYLSLIIGELVPKRLALNNPERIAANVASQCGWKRSLPSSSFVELPQTSVASGHWPFHRAQVTEEEIKVLIEQGTEAGTFEEAEQDMVERVFRLGDRPVNALVTPRPDIVWAT